MSMQTIAIDIPEILYRRLKRLAEVTDRPVENLVVQALDANVPSLPENLSETVRAKLLSLEAADDDVLWALTDGVYPEEKQNEYRELLHKNSSANLTAPEQKEIDAHLEAVNLLTLQKAYAYAILKWRGHAMPTIPRLNSSL